MEVKNVRLSVMPVLLGIAMLFMVVSFTAVAMRGGFSLAWQLADQSLMSSNLSFRANGNGMSVSLNSHNPVLLKTNVSAGANVVNNVQSGLLLAQLQDSVRSYK